MKRTRKAEIERILERYGNAGVPLNAREHDYLTNAPNRFGAKERNEVRRQSIAEITARQEGLTLRDRLDRLHNDMLAATVALAAMHGIEEKRRADELLAAAGMVDAWIEGMEVDG